jgi:hypothetical protein
MKNPTTVFARRERGSAFVTTMIFLLLLIGLMATLLRWSLSERSLNVRNTAWLEARNSAEALAEYGFAQIVTRYNQYATPPTFDPATSTKLQLPPSSFFAGGTINTAAYNATSNPTGLELIAGTYANVPSVGGLYFVDPADPNNSADPLKGQWVYRRDIQVVARATATPASGGPPVTYFLTQKVSVRGAPLFSHAIFYYNNDLEASPGPNFDIYGPVHVNGNMFLSAQGSVETGTANYITFHGLVSASGDLYHAWGNTSLAANGRGYRSSSGDGLGEPLGNDPLNFLSNASTGATTNLKNSSGTWLDSTMGTDNSLVNSYGNYSSTTTSALTQLTNKLDSDNFRKSANQTYNGNLQTGSMGQQAYSPVSYNMPIDSSGTLPDSHTMIERPSPPSSSDPYASAKTEVENQKLSTQAGLYIQVTVTTGASGAPDTATVTAYGPPAGNTSTPNGGNPLGNLPSSLVSFIPYVAQSTSYGSKVTSGTNSGKYPKTVTTYGASSNGSTTTYVSSSGSSSQVVNQGLYDQRQSAGVNLVQVDLAALRAALNDANANANADGKAITDSGGSVWGASGWNGGVYVDVNAPSGNQTSVALANGKVASGSSLLPTVSNVKGLTLATNAPAYIIGNLNADGSISASTSASTPDDGRTNAPSTATSAEIPVAVMSDAITILSPNYFGSTGTDGAAVAATNGSSTSAYGSWSTAAPSASGGVEIAAAFVTGIAPTNSAGFSGGVHNFPRFLENWGSNTVAIRGSMVQMFDSKTATAGWAQRYYSAPKRVWGFDVIFQNGTYPPLTPRVMTYRRIQFNSLNRTTYSSARHSLWPTEF